jgi:hypothetical protein
VFILHPLTAHVSVHPDTHTIATWSCLAAIPDQDGYTYALDPATPAEDIEEVDWIRLSVGSRQEVGRIISTRMSVYATGKAVLDTRTKKLYVADLVGETNGRLSLVLIHYTRKEAKAAARERLAQHAATMRRVCAELYAIETTTLTLNVFYSSPREDGISVKEIWQRVRRRNRRARRPADPTA